MAVKGLHRVSGRSTNYKGSENVITNGSVVAVADGQCMIIVDQGKVTELCAEPGEFVYDSSTEPSIFSGSLGQSILATFKNIGKRFTLCKHQPRDTGMRRHHSACGEPDAHLTQYGEKI